MSGARVLHDGRQHLASDLAEQALGDIESQLEVYVATAPKRPRRISHGRLTDRTAGLTLAGIVGTAERYVTDRMLQLRPTLKPAGLMTWPKRSHAAEREFSLNFATDIPSYCRFRGFVEARNAVLHGGGKLTDLQLGWNRDRSVTDRLLVAGLSTAGRKIVIGAVDVAASASACRNVVNEFDRALVIPA